MTALTLEQIVDRVETLPQLADVTLRLIRVINHPNSTFSEITEVIRYDQTVTAELLRLCNSAAMGLPQRVSSVDDGVRLLGMSRVLQLVMAAHTRALLSPAQAGYGLMPGALWVHSVGVAIAAQILAKRVGLAEHGQAFTIGLLHDVGKIVLNEYVSAAYAEISICVAEQKMSFFEAEQHVLGFSHSEVGALVAEKWQLPGPIVDGIRHHLSPSSAPAVCDLIDVTHLSNAACILMGIGGGDDGLYYRTDPGAISRQGLVEMDIEQLGLEMIGELKAVQELFT